MNRPPTFLDKATTFTDEQVDKVNSMIKTTYNKFVDKTFQKQLGEDRGETAVNAITGRVYNLTSVEYNGVGFASFQFPMIALTEDTLICNCVHEPEDILADGSSFEEGWDSIMDYGYFYNEGTRIYYKLTRPQEDWLFPYVNLSWRYHD